MNKLLTGKVTFVADGTGAIGAGIVRALLQDDAVVIVPAKSAHKIIWLKEYVADIKTGKLATILTDYPDYDKAFDIAEHITGEFGEIDLAVSVFDTPPASPSLTELEISDWQKMTEENITSTFICARVFLSIMKEKKKGTYITISNADDLEKKPWLTLANIAATTQVEMSRIFFDEVKQFGVRYYHLFINNLATRYKKSNCLNKEGWINPEMVGRYIVQLCDSQSSNADNLFQWLSGKAEIEI